MKDKNPENYVLFLFLFFFCISYVLSNSVIDYSLLSLSPLIVITPMSKWKILRSNGFPLFRRLFFDSVLCSSIVSK
jgi:hypothetical protein